MSQADPITCARGVICPIGRVGIDHPAICRLPGQPGYGGHITIEQERDPQNDGSILADLSASRAFLQAPGF